MRYVEGWGSGFLRVNEELAEYGAKPVAIEDAGIATRLNVTRGSSQTAENTSAGDEDNEDNEDNREDNGIHVGINVDTNGTNVGTNGTNVGTHDTNVGTHAEDALLDCIRENPRLSMNGLADRICVSRRTIARMINCLKNRKRIRRVGGTRGHWEVLT